MLEKLVQEGFRLLLYKRYKDDVFAVTEGNVGKRIRENNREGTQ